STQVVFKGVPAGTKVLLVKASTTGQTAEDAGIVIQERDKPINLAVTGTDSVSFWHPHLLIDPNPYIAAKNPPILNGITTFPAQFEKTFQVSPRPGIFHWFWYAFNYATYIGTTLVAVTGVGAV